MTISGGCKFFYKSYVDIDVEDALISVSTGSDSRSYMRDRRTYTRWESVGSSDATTETITLYFEEAKSLNRLIFNRHNWKGFVAKYWDGATYQHFSGVVTEQGTQSNITETTNTKTTNYYEFDTVSTERVQITITTTQTANAEKYIYDLVATKEIGTFTGYPAVTHKVARRQSRKQTVRGLDRFTLFDDQYQARLTFNNYPTAADHTLVMALWETRTEFLFYPCGGKQGQFRFTDVVGYRLRDLYLVWFEEDFDPNYTQNVYACGLNYGLGLVEVT